MLLQIIIPNLMGLVLYQPGLATTGVSAKAEQFCKLLVQSYRFNLFDQLVYQGKNIEAGRPLGEILQQKAEGTDIEFFSLCTAAGNGDVAKVCPVPTESQGWVHCQYQWQNDLPHTGMP